jgi:phosphoenolpyruvate---glycerone phosphotransferase subunit DhaL
MVGAEFADGIAVGWGLSRVHGRDSIEVILDLSSDHPVPTVLHELLDLFIKEENRGMNNEDMQHWLERIATALHENASYLTQLDSAIGDADHGSNMDRGFQAVLVKLPTMSSMDMSTQLKTVGSTLVSTVGGASGPLYGTAFLRAATAINGKETLDSADVVAMLEAFVGGIATRGKAHIGEKTMLDALMPAIDAAKEALASGASVADITSRASRAAEEGMKTTIPMLATKGRASYLGERSIGHQDPGSTSSWLILRSLAEVTAKQA